MCGDDPDRPDEIEGESLDDYAERRGIQRSGIRHRWPTADSAVIIRSRTFRELQGHSCPSLSLSLARRVHSSPAVELKTRGTSRWSTRTKQDYRGDKQMNDLQLGDQIDI